MATVDGEDGRQVEVPSRKYDRPVIGGGVCAGVDGRTLLPKIEQNCLIFIVEVGKW